MGAKKKSESKKADPEQQGVRDMNEMLAGEITILKWQIAMQQQKADRSRAGQNECRQKMRELHTAFEEESKRAENVTSEMRNQYNTMIRDRDEKIGELDSELNSGTKSLQEKEANIRDIIRNKDKEIEKKEKKIRKLRMKIDDMSQKFANMLKTTLDKMQERIELANTQWDSDALA